MADEDDGFDFTELLPLGPDETFTAQVTGTNGNCVGIPADAVGVAMNVTAVGATAAFQLSPADRTPAPASSSASSRRAFRAS